MTQNAPDMRSRHRLMSRKFLVTAAFSFIGTVLVGMGKLTGGEWVTLAVTCVGGYNAGNVLASRR